MFYNENGYKKVVIIIDRHQMRLLKIIKEKEIVTYNELISILGWTRYMIKKYISVINKQFTEEQIDLKINYESRIGIYLTGEDIDVVFNSNQGLDIFLDDDRQLEFISILINSNGYITIQEIADKMFLSRSSVENLLKETRTILQKNGLEVIGTKNGIKIDIDEMDKRKLISKIVNSFKSKIVASQSTKNKFKMSIKFSSDAKQFIDMATLDKVADVLNEFIHITNLYLTDYEFNSLAIHLSISIERIIKEFKVKEVKSTSALEKNTIRLKQLIEKEFGIVVPYYEQEFMNIHITTIQQNPYNKSHYKEDVMDIESEGLSYFTELTQGLVKDISADSILIHDLSIHLRSAVNRLKNNLAIRNPYLVQIKTNFIEAFEYSKKFVSEIEKIFKISFDEDEIAYVAIHIQSFFERIQRRKNVEAYIVCSSGFGTSKLLEQRLNSLFGNQIKIIGTVGIREIDEIEILNKLVITTVPMTNTHGNIVYVSPLLLEKDIENINNKISAFNVDDNSFIELLSESTFYHSEDTLATRDDVMNMMIDELVSHQYVEAEIRESIFNREKMSSTALGDFAMPHGDYQYVKRSSISIYINKNGVEWGEESVKIIFMFLLSKELKPKLNDIYSFFNKVISSERTLQLLIQADTYQEFIKVLQNEVY
ncbi:BglG family transcription antiterminator [Aerococcus sp. HMSC10H05]|uniref:BglG family transcription antiterminator n=1 Tax=Aerococcus sp. HMSC10H05 TaxID=1581084 RepID=UPI0008A4E721|nr:BglG family transcription antiterminator [Aerococcus sp. HMSC10H05]OFU53274.1 hypothetical protein HMPREF3116_00885 [Aerococcus sp. HMSC10H05]